MSRSSKLIQCKEGVLRTCNQLVRSTGDNMDLQLVSEMGVGGSPVGLSPQPVRPDYLQVDIELSCRTPSWCWELLGVGKNHTHQNV